MHFKKQNALGTCLFNNTSLSLPPPPPPPWFTLYLGLAYYKKFNTWKQNKNLVYIEITW